MSGRGGNPPCASRRALLLGAVVSLLPAALRADAPRVIAYVDIDTPGARASYARFLEALAEATRDAEPPIEVRFMGLDQTDPRALVSLGAALQSLSPWLVVATSLPTAREAGKLGRPTLFYSPADPVVLGLVPSTSHPGGAMTGYAGEPASIGKMLELAAEALPRARRLTLVTDRLFARHSATPERLQEVARALGRQLSIGLADTVEEYDALAASRFEDAQALVVPYTAVPFRHSAHVVATEARLRLPALHGSSRLVRAGALLGIEPDISDVPQVFARQAAAIARGLAPGDIPVERPKRHAVTVNLATARMLGIRVPVSILKRADNVVE